MQGCPPFHIARCLSRVLHITYYATKPRRGLDPSSVYVFHPLDEAERTEFFTLVGNARPVALTLEVAVGTLLPSSLLEFFAPPEPPTWLVPALWRALPPESASGIRSLELTLNCVDTADIASLVSRRHAPLAPPPRSPASHLARHARVRQERDVPRALAALPNLVHVGITLPPHARTEHYFGDHPIHLHAAPLPLESALEREVCRIDVLQQLRRRLPEALPRLRVLMLAHAAPVVGRTTGGTGESWTSEVLLKRLFALTDGWAAERRWWRVERTAGDRNAPVLEEIWEDYGEWAREIVRGEEFGTGAALDAFFAKMQPK
ncbi:uncharacterized protein BXZ73DRAFT_103157 [Epithele typhae]|uniref:uncharacterized protein n=1 Tax=Epithele typhae TaxID=378194 RepID=UPI002007F66B|nr:uncharacterized protein BXZ73DRAFT_103157 [Epithele typhae]KAH9925619.1 hypothetical protein BXZ73DRAFT_103157 [Epithele typhae]